MSLERPSRGILPEDITDFLHELALLQSSGAGLDEALSLCERGQEKSAMSRLVGIVREEAARGGGLSVALEKHPRYFQPFLVDVLREAEKNSNPAAGLKEMARYRAATDLSEINLGERLRTALAYPLVLLLIVCLLLGGMMIYVIPVYSAMFSEFGANLPLPTRYLIALSNGLVAYWYLPALLLVLIVGYFLYTWRSGQSLAWPGHVNSRFLLNLPGLGRIYRYLEIIRGLRTWAFVLSRQPELAQALEVSAQVMRTPLYAEGLRKMATRLAAGDAPEAVLETQKLFPRKVAHVLSVAWRAKQFEILDQLADRYQETARQRFDLATRSLTMFSIILIWILIAFALVALYMPIFRMGQVI